MINTSLVEHCVKLINASHSIAVLTGAGISTNAGIPDFRGPKGLYVTRQYDPDTVFDISYFNRDPKPFFDFARDFIGLEETITPTLTHQFLAKLESQGKLTGIITQNIDALHQKAGSKNVYEMHGSIWKSFCRHCREEFSYEQIKQKIKQEEIPRCSCGGVIKPDIVFFGENVKYYEQAVQLAESADLFFIIGTSCVVYPAASIPQFVNGKIVVVNMEEIRLPLYNTVLNVKEDMDQFFSQVTKCLFNKLF